MTAIMTRSAPLTAIVPKGSFSRESRNGLAGLFRDAGYDKVANGDFGDDDSVVEVQQGDFRFLAVKGAGALEYQMWDNSSKPMPIFMGSDVLYDAYWRLVQNGSLFDEYTPPKKLIGLEIGSCQMQFLSPPENAVEDTDDLDGRLIFSKYPALLQKTLTSYGIQAGRIWELNGADTRLKEQIESGNTNAAAFEIVESGTTAIRNGLQISPLLVPEEALPGSEMKKIYPGYSEMNAREVSTNMYLANPNSVTDITRKQILELGLSIEMASRPNTVAMITFNAPKRILGEFARYGMQGPTYSPIIQRENEEQWYSLEIAVGNGEANTIVAEIMQKGGKDVIVRKNQPAAISAETSQIFQNLGLFTKK